VLELFETLNAEKWIAEQELDQEHDVIYLDASRLLHGETVESIEKIFDEKFGMMPAILDTSKENGKILIACPYKKYEELLREDVVSANTVGSSSVSPSSVNTGSILQDSIRALTVELPVLEPETGETALGWQEPVPIKRYVGKHIDLMATFLFRFQISQSKGKPFEFPKKLEEIRERVQELDCSSCTLTPELIDMIAKKFPALTGMKIESTQLDIAMIQALLRMPQKPWLSVLCAATTLEDAKLLKTYRRFDGPKHSHLLLVGGGHGICSIHRLPQK